MDGANGQPAFYRQIADYHERFLEENERRLGQIDDECDGGTTCILRWARPTSRSVPASRRAQSSCPGVTAPSTTVEWIAYETAATYGASVARTTGCADEAHGELSPTVRCRPPAPFGFDE